MTDNLSIPQSDPELDSPKTAGGRLGAALSTSRGRIVAGGIGLVVMLGLLAVVVFVFLLKPDGPAIPPVVKASSTTATTTPVSQAPPVNRPAKAISGEFAFRDIFEPTFVPKPEGTTSSTTTGTASDGTGDTGSSANANDADTLYLVAVATVDGHPTGSFLWNGETFQAAAGEQLGTTPWSVVDIDGDSVTMLYGDSRVTLTVGQGLSK